MAYYSSFSALNEKLRPRLSASDRLYSSLYRMEYGYSGSLKPMPSCYRPSILPATPEPEVPEAAAEPEEPREDAEQEVPEEQPCTGSSRLTEIRGNISEEMDDDDDDSGVSLSEDKDVPGELAPKGTVTSSQRSSADQDGSLERSYVDGTLPDLIRSGRPLGRRRTLGHVSETVGQSKHFHSFALKPENFGSPISFLFESWCSGLLTGFFSSFSLFVLTFGNKATR